MATLSYHGAAALAVLVAVVPLLIVTVVFAAVAAFSALSRRPDRREHTLLVMRRMTDYARALRGEPARRELPAPTPDESSPASVE